MSLLQRAFELIARVVPDPRVDALIDDRGGIQGTPVSRIDGLAKATGSAAFTSDLPFADLAHAAFVCSTVASGTITAIDSVAAERTPGVLLVMTHRNAPSLRPAPLLIDLKGASFTNAPMMQDDRIRWDGEPVAVVVADTLENARAAASMVKVTYSPDPAARTDFEVLKTDATRAEHVQTRPARLTKGDAEKALGASVATVDQVFRTPRNNHAAIEPHVCVAKWNGASLTLWDATQTVTHGQMTLAEVFGLPRSQVRVVSQFVGGAFGNKMMWSYQVLCAAAARMVDRPVRSQLSRQEVFRLTGGRTLSEQRVALGVSAQHRLSGLVHQGTTAIGVNGNGFAEQVTFPARELYAAEQYLIDQHVVELHMVPNASMRAPGESIGGFALESAVDEIAHDLGVDPIELRRGWEPEVNPTSGRPFSSRHLVEVFDQGAARFGWGDRNPNPRSQRDGEWWVGTGVAACNYPYVRLPGSKVRVSIKRDGSAEVATAAHEMGMGTATVQTQHAADRLGLTFDKVTFLYGDSDLPAGAPAGGSTQTAAITGAVVAARDDLVKKLLRLAGRDSVLGRAKPREVELRDGGVHLLDGSGGISYNQLLERSGTAEVSVTGSGSLPFEMMKYAMQSFGAQFCEVRVSEITGEIRVSRWLGMFDTGRVLNPKTAASQFRGGIVMGLGQALTEETIFDDRRGRIMNPSMAHYHVPVHADVPPIDVDWLDIPDPLAPMGGHGVGEIGITGVAAAISNAVFNAAGIRLRQLPMTPRHVLPELMVHAG